MYFCFSLSFLRDCVCSKWVNVFFYLFSFFVLDLWCIQKKKKLFEMKVICFCVKWRCEVNEKQTKKGTKKETQRKAKKKKNSNKIQRFSISFHINIIIFIAHYYSIPEVELKQQLSYSDVSQLFCFSLSWNDERKKEQNINRGKREKISHSHFTSLLSNNNNRNE